MPRSKEATKVSKAYLLGWSDMPFKEPGPSSAPMPRRREVDLINTPGALLEWIASDGRKGKLTGIPKISLGRGPLTAAKGPKASTRAGDTQMEQFKSTSNNQEANRSAKRHATPPPDELSAALWAKLGSLQQNGNTPANTPALANGIAQAAVVAPPAVTLAPVAPDAPITAVLLDAAGADTSARAAFTTAQDAELLRRKTENETWLQIATALAKSRNECKERFKLIKPKDWRANLQGKDKDKAQKEEKEPKQQRNEGMKEQEEEGDDGNGLWGVLPGLDGECGTDESKKEEEKGADDNNNPTWDGTWVDPNGGHNGDTAQKTSWNAAAWDDTDNSWDPENHNKSWDNDEGSSKAQKTSKTARSTSGQSNAWNNGGNGWDNTSNNCNAGGSNNGSNGNGDASASSSGYRELYPDETFSMDDLACISKLFKRDNDQLYFRISCAFRDKTGRYIPEEVFREKFGI